MTRATLEPGDDLAALAESRIRKLANRHGCTRKRCPDPAAHRDDVAGMSTVLMAAGLASYQSGRRPVAARNFGRKKGT